MTTLVELKEAAEAEQLRVLSGLGARTEERILEALSTKSTEEPAARCSGGSGRCSLSSLRPARASGRRSRLRGRQRPPPHETFRDLDIIATATEPRGADRVLRRA